MGFTVGFGSWVASLCRTTPVLVCALCLAVATANASGAEGERPRRVLIVHSFGGSAPPFTTHSTAFEEAIKREMGAAGVDLDEISLNMARYAQPDMEEAFTEFIGKRMSVWEPDVVVPIGSPAGRFVSKHRAQLFPRAPVVYVGMDRRTLPSDAFADNATFVGESFDLEGLVDDMLQLDPKTKNVFVILGSTPLERYWATEFKKAFEPFAGQITFTWSNDMTFAQMLDTVANLPPHSFVLIGLFMRDASGVTYNEEAALARLSAVSRAPINGMFQHQVGQGIVGGRLYQGELQGEEGARAAARILRGEPASSIPPLVIGTREPLYDWRELQRWGFSESRLPAGSVVLFREPTVWERYRWHVVGAVAVIATQAALISALLVQRRRRSLAELAYRESEAEVQQKRAQLEHVKRVATVGELTTTLTHEIKQPLHAVMLNSDAVLRLLDQPQPNVEELREAVRDIRDTTRRTGDVLEEIRGMLRRDTPGFATLDLNDLLRTVKRIVHGDAMLHGVTVDLDLAPGALTIKGDSVQLQQVLLNLMLNAFAAMNSPELDGARRLTVRTRTTDKLEALVEVQDCGTGIPPERLESIFDPFFTSKGDGLGLGLSICRSIIEHHGGRVWASNNADRGATLSITVPIDHAPMEHDRTRSSARASGIHEPAAAGRE